MLFRLIFWIPVARGGHSGGRNSQLLQAGIGFGEFEKAHFLYPAIHIVILGRRKTHTWRIRKSWARESKSPDISKARFLKDFAIFFPLFRSKNQRDLFIGKH